MESFTAAKLQNIFQTPKLSPKKVRFKIDNPSYEYFITAVKNCTGESEPDEYVIDMLERSSEYSGIIDNDGRVFLISR